MNADREAEIVRTWRHACATGPTEEDSWLNGYQDDVEYLLAALTDARQERDENLANVRAIDDLRMVEITGLRARLSAAEDALREAWEAIAAGRANDAAAIIEDAR